MSILGWFMVPLFKLPSMTSFAGGIGALTVGGTGRQITMRC
jgi:hypothetical protein